LKFRRSIFNVTTLIYQSNKSDRGSFEGQKRLEFDFITIHITHPESVPLLPKVNPALGFPDPVDEEYLDDYLPYLMTGEETS